jgi:hypothetical protein
MPSSMPVRAMISALIISRLSIASKATSDQNSSRRLTSCAGNQNGMVSGVAARVHLA